MKFICEFENVESLKTRGKAVIAFDKTLCQALHVFGDKPVITRIADQVSGELTEFPAEIIKIRSLKTTGKAEMTFDRERYGDVVKYNDGEVIIEILVDTPEQIRRMSMISGEQRRKIFALIKDIAHGLAENSDSLREHLTNQYCYENQIELFSLSDVSRVIAESFIEWLITWAFENGIEMQDKPKSYFDDIERYHAVCLKTRKCCVCGKHGETHHLDAIGMGRNRTKVDDYNYRKVCLCREHHTEAHTGGWKKMVDKYHL